MEPIDDEARIAGVDAHGIREAALVDSRLDLKSDKRPVLQLHHLFAGKGFRNHGGADLLKTTRQWTRTPGQGRSTASGWAPSGVAARELNLVARIAAARPNL